MPTAATIIQALRPFKWRGNTVLIESAPVDFAHRQAPREYYGVNGEGHDNTGMAALKCRVKMFFLNTVEKDSFPDKWGVWQRALFDGSSGDLEHPVLGKFRARVEGGSIQFAAQTTAGLIVEASFTETVDDIDKQSKFFDPEPSFVSVAKAASLAASAYGIKWPSQKLNTSLEDAFRALASGVFGAQVSIAGLANQIAGDLLDMIAAAEALTDPASYPVYDLLVFAWTLAKNAADRASRDLRSTGKRIVQNDTTLAAFAAEVGNTEDEIMQLNLALLRSPIVASGKSVTFYTGK
jgi:hypothetical protein